MNSSIGTSLNTQNLRLIEEFAKNKQKNNTINWLNQLSKNKIQKRLDQSKLECIRFSDSRSSQRLEAWKLNGNRIRKLREKPAIDRECTEKRARVRVGTRSFNSMERKSKMEEK